MATARKKKTAAARKAARKTKSARARPKAAARRPRRAGKGLRGLLIHAKTVGLTAGVVAVAAMAGYGVYRRQARNAALTPAQAPSSSGLPYKSGFAAQAGARRGDRIAYWSGEILAGKVTTGGMKRLVSGVEIDDNAPLIPDRFNCTTFVETVAAFALSDGPEAFAAKLTSIRYKDGRFTFAHRNHFPEVDWIPNNARAGNLTDITAQVAHAAGVSARVESKEIRRHEWLASLARENKVSRSLASAAEKQWPATARAEVRYIELASLGKVMAFIPTGTVINIVHRDAKRKPVLISHQGLVIQENGRTYMRHSSTQGELKQSPLDEYLGKLSRGQEKKASWPLIGFNLNQIN